MNRRGYIYTIGAGVISTTTVSANRVTSAADTAQDGTHIDVGAGDNGFQFAPDDVVIEAGTAVVWEWTGNGGAHNVASDDDNADFESELTDASWYTFTHTFEEPGTYDYVCIPHRALGMSGRVRVEPKEVGARVDVGAGDNGFQFAPDDVVVEAGTAVVWEWTGNGGAHNVASDDDNPNNDDFESELVDTNGYIFTHTFEEPGTYDYVCIPHQAQGMSGQVTVEQQENDGGASPHASEVAEIVGGNSNDALYQGRDGTAYQGQNIIVTGERIAPDETYSARTVDSFTTEAGESGVESSSQIEALETYTEDGDPKEIPAYAQGKLADGEAFLVLETDEYDAGDIFIQGGDLPVNPVVTEGTFEIVVQDLSLTFEDDDTPVASGGADAIAELRIDSNRIGYNISVNTNGNLDDDKLIQIFVNTGLNSADGNTGGTEYTEAEIKNAILDAREFVTTTSDGNLLVNETGVVAINDTDYVTVGDLVNLDANPFNALAYSLDETDDDDSEDNVGPEEKIVLYHISNPEEDVDFTEIDDAKYEFSASSDSAEATASTSIQVNEETSTPPGEHESGVSQGLFDTADQNGDNKLSRTETRGVVEQFVRDGETNGVPIERTDIRSLVRYLIQH